MLTAFVGGEDYGRPATIGTSEMPPTENYRRRGERAARDGFDYVVTTPAGRDSYLRRGLGGTTRPSSTGSAAHAAACADAAAVIEDGGRTDTHGGPRPRRRTVAAGLAVDGVAPGRRRVGPAPELYETAVVASLVQGVGAVINRPAETTGAAS